MLEIDARGDVVEVEDLGAASLLELAKAVNHRERIETRNKLRLAYQWCVLHPATEESGVETPVGPSLSGLAGAESLGGEGTPLVAAFAPEPLAAAWGVSPPSAAGLLADVLDLVHRLPKLWARVDALDISAWTARRIAQLTHTLSHEAAAYVDERLSSATWVGLSSRRQSPRPSRTSTPTRSRRVSGAAIMPGTSASRSAGPRASMARAICRPPETRWTCGSSMTWCVTRLGFWARWVTATRWVPARRKPWA